MKRKLCSHLMALAVMAGGPMAVSAGSLTDLGTAAPAGLANPSGNGTKIVYKVDVTRDGTMAAGTDLAGNAYLWPLAGSKVTIGAGYTVMAARWWTNGSTTVLAVANQWGNSVTRPWVWTGNSDGSGGTWTQLPGGSGTTTSTGYWFGTGLGITNGGGDYWVSGYTTNTSTGHKQGVGYQYIKNYSQVCNTSSTTNWNAQGNSGHQEFGFYATSDTGWMAGTEGYGGSGSPGSGSINGCYWTAWYDVSIKPRPHWFGPPENSGKPTTSYNSTTATISTDGTIKAGTDKNGTIYWGLWWDNVSPIPNVHKLPQLLISGTTLSDWMEVHSLNKDGMVMGGEYYRTDAADAWYEAFVCYRSGTTITTTNKVGDLLNAYGIATNNWIFSDVTSFNNDGNVLAGWGTNTTDHLVHGWVAQLLTVSVQTVSSTCGNSDGSIQVTASGVGPYKFSKDGGATWTAAQVSGTYTFSSLPAGVYTVQAQDSYGYPVNYSGNPVIFGTSFSSVTTVNVTCNGGNNGSITVTAPSAAPPLQFSDDGGTTWNAGTSPYTFSALAAGNYNISVRDANQCTVNYSGNPVTITQPTAVTISAATANNGCNGANNGSITVTASGGTGVLQFSDDGGTTWNAGISPYIFSSLAPNTYNIEVMDANGCTTIYGSNPVTISDPPLLTASAGSDALICVGKTIQLNGLAGGGTSPYTYAWTPATGLDNASIANPKASPATTTLYTLTVTDANSCTANASVTITVNPLPTLTATLVGSAVVVSWPVTCTMQLFQNPNLTNPAGWVIDTNAVNTVGGINYVTNAMSSVMFFRLQDP